MAKYWLAIAVAIACNVAANLSLKSLSGTTGTRGLVALLSNPYLWILVVTGAGLLGAYAFALNGIRLHVAYTFVTSGALVVLALVSAVLLGQTINALNWLGIVLIIVGIVLVSN